MIQIDSLSVDSLQNIKLDSLNNVTAELAESVKSYNDNILALISTVVVILIFLIERYINHRYVLRGQAKDFYYNIILLPNVDKVNNFFESFSERLQSGVAEVRQFKGSGDEMNEKKEELLNELKEDKIDFDHSFISLVRAGDSSRAVNLTNYINELDDIATKCLTSTDLVKLKFSEVRKEIFLLRAKFFDELYMLTDNIGKKSA